MLAENISVNWSALLEQFQGRKAFVTKLLKVLMHSHAETPSKLRAAAQAANLEQIAFVSHSFAGVAGQVCADNLRTFAKEIERKAKAGDQEACPQAEILAQLVEDFFVILQDKLREFETT